MPLPGERIIAQARVTLVNTTVNAASGGTVDFGTFPSDKFARLVGIFSVVGSFTFRFQQGASSGSYAVSSSSTVNSGGSVFDQVQYGPFLNLGFTAVVSSAPTVYLAGEPVR